MKVVLIMRPDSLRKHVDAVRRNYNRMVYRWSLDAQRERLTTVSEVRRNVLRREL
jgi:hypothetical protein